MKILPDMSKFSSVPKVTLQIPDSQHNHVTSQDCSWPAHTGIHNTVNERDIINLPVDTIFKLCNLKLEAVEL